MPLLPVAASRTSMPLRTQRLLYQLNADQLAIQKQFDQLSTGRRVLRISDDPAAAGRAVGLQRGIDRTTQLSRNADFTRSLYNSTDAALARVDEALILARSTSVQASQSVISQSERESLATTVRQTLESIFSAGNAMFRDHQLLGGALDHGEVLRWSGNDVVFQGRDAVGQTKLGAGDPVDINVSGHQALGVRSVILKGEPLDSSIRVGTRLLDLKQGAGVTPGVLRISDGNEWQTVDLQHAATVGDVVQTLESIDLAGRNLAVTISNDSLQIDYADGLPGTLAIADAEGSTMASEVGIENASGIQPPPLTASGLTPRVTEATELAQLDSGNGITLSGSLRIAQGDEAFTVDVSSAETVGDVLIAINRSGADVHAELDGHEGRIAIRSLRSGVNYSIGENGSDVAEQLGIRSADRTTALADLGGGRGLELNPTGDDLVITRPDGVQLGLNLENAETVEDVMDLIRLHPQNQDPLRVLVDLAEVGNGLRLLAPPGAGTLTLTQPLRSNAGERLGLIPVGESESTGQIDGGVVSIQGDDFLPLEPGDLFDTLLRLEDAIRGGNVEELDRLQSRLDDDFNRSSRTRGRVGIWSQRLEQLQVAAEDDLVALKSQLSDEVDADFATVISDLTQRQTALEASMRIIGQTAQLTVLNYI